MSAPAWITERHGEVWDIREFRFERRVAAFRWTLLPRNRVGTNVVLASSWAHLAQLLDDEAEFDAMVERRIASSRAWRLNRAQERLSI